MAGTCSLYWRERLNKIIVRIPTANMELGMKGVERRIVIKVILTHCGRVTQICVFTLQLCKTDDANLRF